jgi:hypothetical protein
LDFLRTPESSKSDLKGQNSLNWKVPYTIENLLILRHLKWVRMIHLNIYNTNYGWKKRSGVKVSIWLSIIKNRESPWIMCVQVMCHILLENSWLGLQLCFKLHFNRRSTQNVMGFQSGENSNFGNFKTPNLKVPKKMTFGCNPPG